MFERGLIFQFYLISHIRLWNPFSSSANVSLVSCPVQLFWNVGHFWGVEGRGNDTHFCSLGESGMKTLLSYWLVFYLERACTPVETVRNKMTQGKLRERSMPNSWRYRYSNKKKKLLPANLYWSDFASYVWFLSASKEVARITQRYSPLLMQKHTSPYYPELNVLRILVIQ